MDRRRSSPDDHDRWYAEPEYARDDYPVPAQRGPQGDGWGSAAADPLTDPASDGDFWPIGSPSGGGVDTTRGAPADSGRAAGAGSWGGYDFGPPARSTDPAPGGASMAGRSAAELPVITSGGPGRGAPTEAPRPPTNRREATPRRDEPSWDAAPVPDAPPSGGAIYGGAGAGASRSSAVPSGGAAYRSGAVDHGGGDRTRRPAIAVPLALLVVILELPALRLLLGGVGGGPAAADRLISGIGLMVSLPLLATGLYGVLTIGSGAGQQAWWRPPVAYLIVGLVLFLAAAVAAG